MGLFSGKPEAKPSPASTTPMREHRTPEPRVSAQVPTVIGKDAIIKGELSSQNDMLIQGRVEGKIRGSKRVTIGEDGNVQAQIFADVVTVQGEVHGDCEATAKVEIARTGKVYGNISAQAIVVAEGATFRGASKMLKPAQPKPVQKAPSSSAPSPGQPGGSAPPPPRAN